jgi:hypothetical protein
MSSNELKGDAFLAEAEKKVSGGGFMSFFGSKKDKAREGAELCDKAANTYKLDKKCTLNRTN